MFVDTLTTHTTRAVHKGRRGRGERETGHGRHRRPSTVGCTAVRTRRRRGRGSDDAVGGNAAIVLDACGRVANVAPSACSILGVRSADLVGTTIGQLAAPEDRLRLARWLSEVQASAARPGRADVSTIAFRVARRHDRQADARRSIGWWRRGVGPGACPGGAVGGLGGCVGRPLSGRRAPGACGPARTDEPPARDVCLYRGPRAQGAVGVARGLGRGAGVAIGSRSR